MPELRHTRRSRDPITGPTLVHDGPTEPCRDRRHGATYRSPQWDYIPIAPMGPGGHGRNGAGQKGLKRVFGPPSRPWAETHGIPDSSGPQTLAGRVLQILKIPEGPPRRKFFNVTDFSTISDS